MHPVTSIGEQGLLLRAALRRCARRARPGPVHELRTATRRIEAMLELLAQAGRAEAEPAAERFRRAARQIRRAAGAARDLDVQLELLAELRGPGIQMDRKKLADRIKARRERRGAALGEEIEDRGERLLRALERLEIELAPALETGIAETRLREIAREIFRRANARTSRESLADAETLHGLRKSAKTARYITELVEKPAARPLAGSFHALQQKIGEWHDALLLAEFAGKHLEAGSALLRMLEQRQRRAHGVALRRAEGILRENLRG